MSARTRMWILVTGALCVALLMFGVLGGLLPQLTNAATTRGIAADQDQQTQLYTTQVAALATAEERAAELEQQLGDLRIAIPSEFDSKTWVAQLADIEASSGATVTGFGIVPPLVNDASDAATDESSATGLTTIGYTLDLSGTETQINDFVAALQTGARLTRIISAEYHHEAGERWSALLTASLYAQR